VSVRSIWKRLRVLLAWPACALVVVVLVLLAFNLTLIRVLDRAGAGPGGMFVKQTIYAAGGLIVMAAVAALPYQKLGRWAYGLFAAAVALLGLLVLARLGAPLLGRICPQVNGAYRWIRLGPVQVQPSEFAKIAYILALAWYLRYRHSYRRLVGLLGPFAVTLAPMALILVEPDLGTVLLFLPVLFVMLFAAGAKVRHLGLVILLGVLSLPGFFMLMQPYQRNRVLGVLLQSQGTRRWLAAHPAVKNRLYPGRALKRWQWTPEGYQLHHAKQALGSGRTHGHGLGKGAYFKRPRQLPHSHNDFIYAIIGHQFGFIGSAIVIAAYLVFALVGVEIAGGTDDPFGRLVAVGVVAMIVTQAFINIAMTMGLMPITGVTLPFVSYGGSSLVTSLALTGLLVSVSTYRPVIISRKPFEFTDQQ